MIKQISDNEIYLFIKYIKSILWRVAKRLSYIQDARCLKVKLNTGFLRKNLLGHKFVIIHYVLVSIRLDLRII